MSRDYSQDTARAKSVPAASTFARVRTALGQVRMSVFVRVIWHRARGHRTYRDKISGFCNTCDKGFA